MATTAYCTVDDLRDHLGAVGVSLRLEDMPPTTLGDVIRGASTKVDQYCRGRGGYRAAALATSDWVNDTATSIALMYLCSRQANPAPISIAADYKEAIEDLKAIGRGETSIPDCARARPLIPSLSNVGVQLHPVPHTRVRRSTSAGTNPTDYAQKVDRFDYLDYVI